VACLRRGDFGDAAKHFHNALQIAAEQLCEWIARLKHTLATFDCLAHQMSGSGSAYFGLCRHARHARRIAASLRSRGVGQVYAVGAGI
jgi:4-diphosphocytidyl-2-C-methyl-D-erythritol kinase